MAHFEYSSVIAAPKADVFEFLSDIKNLKTIMAPDFNVELTSPAEKMKKGAEFELRLSRYGLSVLMGLTVEEYNPPELIRDRQTHGPFALWIHTHKIEDHGQGTLLKDLIEYDVPFGIVGKLAEDLVIRRELEKLFKNRHARIQEMVVKRS